MATVGSRGTRLSNANQHKSIIASPEKVRQLLNEGVISPDRPNSLQGKLKSVDPDSVDPDCSPAPCEAGNKDAFFSRVESYSCLRWAGKPRGLSPLRCASYGWVNVGSDMLKCSSCQAFLCASLLPTLDFSKYESRIAEISRQLQTQHEKFCPWPDFPCPERFWVVPSSSPAVLLASFLQRFQSACLLEQQLPAMKLELTTMALTEDVISVLLQLVEEEHRKQGGAPTPEPLAVQVAACIVSLCGWSSSPALHAMNLPILTCSFCMRKVGLWNFHQMEGAVTEGDTFQAAVSPCTPPPPPTLAPAPQEAPGDRSAPPSPCGTPRRMKLRSQDTSRPEQGETSPPPPAPRTRSRDSPSPSEELPSPRGKRTSSRGKGPGDGGSDGASSPQHTPKRPRLSSTGGPEGPIHRNAFDPLAQHRDWCPWVTAGKENAGPGAGPLPRRDPPQSQQGWKAALDLLLPMKKNSNTGSGLKQGPHDKSKRVFAILRQWQVASQ